MRVIGMISGTSFDAVEALLADIELEGEVLTCHLVEHRSVPYPQVVRQAIAAILPPAMSAIPCFPGPARRLHMAHPDGWEEETTMAGGVCHRQQGWYSEIL